MRKRIIISVAAVVIIAVVLVLVLRTPVPTIRVGSKGFTEQLIVGEMMAQLLEEHLEGVRVELVDGLGTPALRAGIEAGQLDVIAEYTGTAWEVHFGQEYQPGVNNTELYQLVKERDEANNITWLDPLWNNNTYAFASWPEFVAAHNLSTLSDLAELYRQNDGKIWMSVTLEFEVRPDGLPALQEHYGFEVDPDYLLSVEAGLTTVALAAEEVDVGGVFGTDAIMAEYGWHVYADDQALFPPYDMTPSVRDEVLEEHPDIADVLNELVATFPGGGQSATPEIVAECQVAWQELNYRVDVEKMLPEEVAREYLIEHGLIEE